jgi:hypothetical protein
MDREFHSRGRSTSADSRVRDRHARHLRNLFDDFHRRPRRCGTDEPFTSRFHQPIVDTHGARFYTGRGSLEIFEMTIATVVAGRWRMDR